jgi:hypothetical protein
MTILTVDEQRALVGRVSADAALLKAHLIATGDQEGLSLYRRTHASARTLKHHLATEAGQSGDVTTFGGTPTPDDGDTKG